MKSYHLDLVTEELDAVYETLSAIESAVNADKDPFSLICKFQSEVSTLQSWGWSMLEKAESAGVEPTLEPAIGPETESFLAIPESESGGCDQGCKYKQVPIDGGTAYLRNASHCSVHGNHPTPFAPLKPPK